MKPSTSATKSCCSLILRSAVDFRPNSSFSVEDRDNPRQEESCSCPKRAYSWICDRSLTALFSAEPNAGEVKARVWFFLLYSGFIRPGIAFLSTLCVSHIYH